MTLSVKTKLSALKLPAVVEKDGVRYKCDIVDADQGIDLALEREEVEKRGGGGQRTVVRPDS